MHVYNGVIYNTEIAARWSAFFSFMNIPFVHKDDHEFDIDGFFWIVDRNIWVVINTNNENEDLGQYIADFSGNIALELKGPPSIATNGTMFYPKRMQLISYKDEYIIEQKDIPRDLVVALSYLSSDDRKEVKIEKRQSKKIDIIGPSEFIESDLCQLYQVIAPRLLPWIKKDWTWRITENVQTERVKWVQCRYCNYVGCTEKGDARLLQCGCYIEHDKDEEYILGVTLELDRAYKLANQVNIPFVMERDTLHNQLFLDYDLRIWLIDQKRMVKIDVLEDMVREDGLLRFYDKHSGKWIKESGDTVFMRPIGITDSNGRVMFEGDIIQSPINDMWVIEWDKTLLSFRFMNKQKDGSWVDDTGYLLGSGGIQECTIISNRHEGLEIVETVMTERQWDSSIWEEVDLSFDENDDAPEGIER